MEEDKSAPRPEVLPAYNSQPVANSPPSSQSQATPTKHTPESFFSQPVPPKLTQMCSPGKRVGKPRLMIERLELENFKSYAGRKIIGPFHKYFTSVVGPNGSGKSNVIDSLMFVFGKRSKRLRIHKLTDVIHKSSSARDLKFARVSVYFQEIIDTGDGDDDFKVIEGSRFVVSHEVRKSGESFYKIDGVKRTFEDVNALLKTKGIDLEYNRFLLLQGEVESISMMKPKGTNPNEIGLLEYLEDVIGTDRYKEPIENREKAIEIKEEDKSQKESKLKDVRKQLLELEEPKNKAIEYIKKEKMRFAADNLVQQIEKFEITQELNLKETERKSLELEKAKAEEEKKAKLRENAEFQKALQESNEELQKNNVVFEKSSKEYSVIEKKYEEGLQELKRLHDLQVKLEDQLKKKKKEHTNLVQGRVQTEKKIPEVEKEIAGMKTRAEELLSSVQVKEKEVTETMGEFNKRKQEVENKLVPQKKRQEELKRKLDALTAEIDSLEANEKKNYETRQTLTQKVAELRKEEESKRTELKTLEDKQTRHKKELEEGKKKEISLVEEEKHLVSKIQEQASRIQSAKASAQESQSKNALLKALLAAQERGHLRGIIGRLGDLGSIEEIYDVAITNACPQLDSVVVQTAEQASSVIEYMKEKRLGRASLTIMDIVLKKYRDDVVLDLPKGVPCKRLIDLVRPRKEEYKAAFYSVLGNTLVVESLDNAMKLNYGKKRFRVVTLKGDVIEISGTMSGGGKPRRGGMSAVQRGEDELSPEQILRLENELELTKAQLKEIKEKQAIHRGLIGSAETLLGNMETKKNMLSMETQSLGNQLKEFENKLAALEEIAKKKEGRGNSEEYIESLKIEAHKISDQLQPLENEVKKYEEKLKKLEEQLNEAGGEDYRNLKEEYEFVKKAIAEKDHELDIAKAELEDFPEKLKRIEKQLEQTHTQLERCVTDCKEKENELESLKTRAKELQTAIEEAKIKRDDLGREFKEKMKQNQIYQDEIKSLEGKIGECKKRADELDKDLKKLKDSEKSIEKAIQDNRKNYEHTRGEYDFLDDIENLLNSCADLSQSQSQSPVVENPPEEKKESPEVVQPTEEVKEELERPAKRRKTEIDIEQILATKEVETDYTEEELGRLVPMQKQIKYQMAIIAAALEQLQGNLSFINDYRIKYKEFKEKKEVYDKAMMELKSLKQEYEELKRKRKEEFMEGFNLINTQLKQMFRAITMGGDADLELKDTLNPFEEGIIYTVRPYKKSWKDITKLSGGEKTLSSLSLVFAVHHYKPSPLYCLDEIDAALDYRNVSIVGQYLQKRAKDCQFIIISLRNNMFELANQLVGIYMVNNITSTVAFNPRKMLMRTKPFSQSAATQPVMGRHGIEDKSNDKENKDKRNPALNLSANY